MAGGHYCTPFTGFFRYVWLFIAILCLAAACTFSPASPSKNAALPTDTIAPLESYTGLPAGSAPQGWVNMQSENFSQTSSVWPDQQKFVNGEAYLDVNILNAAYQWHLNTLTGSFFYLYPQMDDQADAIVWVDATCAGCKPQWDYGLIFRLTEAGWMYFSVNEEGTVKLLEFQERFWSEVISPVTTPAFKPGQTNRLGLRAEGAQVTLLINQQEVATTPATWLEAGKFGLAASQTEPGDMTVIFDNWEFNAKSEP